MSLSQRLRDRGIPAPAPQSRAGIAAWRSGVPVSTELKRITALPRRVIDLARVEDLTPAFRIERVTCTDKHCRVCALGIKLLPIQSAMLWDAEQSNGLFAPVGVGHGKTLASFLLPAAMSSKVSVLLIPPHLREKTQENWRVLARHFALPPRESVHVVAYSELSTASTADVLDKLAPDLVIADEAHCLRHKDAARTKRFLRYFKERPSTRFCALSGSMTDKSIKDYSHLIELALHKNSPLPVGYRELCDWAEALDVSEDPMPPGALVDLVPERDEAEKSAQGRARSAFRRRLVETPGVVATEESAVGTSLTIKTRKPQAFQMVDRDPSCYFMIDLPEAVRAALEQLHATWAIGEEELTDAMSLSRVARQLALGFYYRWAWPGGVKDVDWLAARSAWHRCTRHVLRYKARAGLDSPLLVSRAALRGELAAEEQAAWEAWNKVNDRPEPPTEPVWLDDYAVIDAAVWAREAPGLVWYEHSAFGARVAEKLALPCYGGGTADLLRMEKGDRSVVLSVKAHSEGHDHLSVFARNLVTCSPSNGKTWEQMLGRTHRQGQQADEVQVDVYLHTDALQSAFDSALESAEYIERTQGQRQKLLYATRII